MHKTTLCLLRITSIGIGNNQLILLHQRLKYNNIDTHALQWLADCDIRILYFVGKLDIILSQASDFV